MNNSIGLTAILALSVASTVHGQATVRVSVASDGSQANGPSRAPSISADGNLIAFESSASNLVPGDTNMTWDVFVHNRRTGATTRVSVGTGNTQAIYGGENPFISADGRYVAFASGSGDLVPMDTNGRTDIFVHDRLTRSTSRVSVPSTGGQADDHSSDPVMSADGSVVAFLSIASNLVPDAGEAPNGLYVRDLIQGATTHVSVSSDGAPANNGSGRAAISHDGRILAFSSSATNLVGGDENFQWDVFVHDTQTGTTELISRSTSGVQGNYGSYSPTMTADGRFVAFNSFARTLTAPPIPGLSNIYLRDRLNGTTIRITNGTQGPNGYASSSNPVISSDGLLVAFASTASDLVPDDTNSEDDIFAYDRRTEQMIRVSVASDGSQANRGANYINTRIAATARSVAFSSNSSNLVANDTNRVEDVFVRDILPLPALPGCPGDANNDNQVGFRDLTTVLDHWGADYLDAAGLGDANRDGTVNSLDILRVLKFWNWPCR